jgi:hypothetical protein
MRSEAVPPGTIFTSSFPVIGRTFKVHPGKFSTQPILVPGRYCHSISACCCGWVTAASRFIRNNLTYRDNGKLTHCWPLDVSWHLMPTTGGVSSVGRASASQAECREFESRTPLHFLTIPVGHRKAISSGALIHIRRPGYSLLIVKTTGREFPLRDRTDQVKGTVLCKFSPLLQE